MEHSAFLGYFPMTDTEFPRSGAPTRKAGAPTFWLAKIFPEKCMALPLDPPTCSMLFIVHGE